MNLILLMLAAPSATYEKSDLDTAKAIWEAGGFRVHNILEPRKGETPYLNGSDAERYADLCQRPVNTKTPQVMIAVRGGYGALRFFNYPVDEQNPALLLGYSDASIIHLQRFYQKGWIGIHGPNFLGVGKYEQKPEVISTLRNLIQGNAAVVNYPSLTLIHGRDTSAGELIVMNLASLQSVAGLMDPSFFAGKILAIEDINEPLYKIDRMITHLALAGFLENIAGLILGQFHDEDVLLDNREIWQQVIKPLYESKKYEFPVYSWPIFGHGVPNMPLLFGAPIHIARATDGDGELYLHYNVESP